MIKLRRAFDGVSLPEAELRTLFDEVRTAQLQGAERVIAANEDDAGAWGQMVRSIRDNPHKSLDVVKITVQNEQGTWTIDGEQEFLRKIRPGYLAFSLRLMAQFLPVTIELSGFYRGFEVGVEGADEGTVLDWMDRFERMAVRNPLPAEPEERPSIFIGHGQSPAWKQIKEFVETLGYTAHSFETLPHTGVTISNVLETALATCSFALLVMTAEDERADKLKQARLNVVHELGLFQGQLGWANAVVLLEHEAEEFSNIAGTQQIRFRQPSDTFGEIAKVLQQRFGNL